MKGELVGINTAIISPGGGNVGIGFAVPINMARQAMEQIVESGTVRRGRIGISVQDPNTVSTTSRVAGRTEGALIAGVLPGSSAETAGIRKGDIVIPADGVPVRSAAQLRNKIGLTRVGKRVQLTLDRNGALHTVVVEISAARGTGHQPRLY